MFSPKSPFPEWICLGYLFIAEILDGFRELVTGGKVSFMDYVQDRAGNINSVREWPVTCL